MIIITDMHGLALLTLHVPSVTAASDEVIVWALPCEGGEGEVDLEGWACVPIEGAPVGTMARYRRAGE